MRREDCGCRWDDDESPVDMCELHCPPQEPSVSFDEHMTLVMGRHESMAVAPPASLLIQGGDDVTF
jgi:hypothetical protein